MGEWLERLLGITPGDLAGADEWTLRFVGVPASLWTLMGMAVALAVLVALTVRSYRREGDAPARAKAFLAGVRIAAILALFALLLQPAIVLRYKKTLHSTVVFLVDNSLSMRRADRWADTGERTALASLLNLAPEKLSGDERPSRLEIMKRALAREGGPLARLAEDHPLALVAFSTAAPGKEAYTQMPATTQPTRPDSAAPREAAGAAASPPAEITAALTKLDASGYETNLGRALREAVEKVEGRRVAAIVVVSDGQNTSRAEGGRAQAAIDLARERGIPVYAVAVGDPAPPKNILVAQLQGPGEVRKGSTAAMTAFLAHRGFAGTTVTVDLARAPLGSDRWEETGIAESVALAGGEGDAAGDLQEVVLRVPMNEVGQYRYKASVKPRDEEIDRTDNEAAATVKVTDEKTTVLFVSGDSGWEFQYLRNYFLRHGEHYRVSVWQQNADPEFNQEASSGMKRRTLPRTREDLYQYDVVILYDPRHTGNEFDATFAGLLEEFVSRHHGGIAYVAGNKFTDANLLAAGPFDALAGLLPVVLERDAAPLAARLTQANRTAWPVQVTAFGADHPVMQLETGAAENEQAWRRMPGLYWSHPVARLKTLASALAVSSDPARQTADGQPEPLIAVQYYGKGRVLFLGFDGTWRWRYVRDACYYNRFWGNVVDFLAAGRLEKKRVIITTGGAVFDAGSDIRVRVEAYTRDFAPMDAKTFTVRLAPLGGGEASEHVLAAVKEGFFEGVIPAARTGRFEIVPKADPGGAGDWTDQDVTPKRIEIRLPEEEFRRPEADREALRELAGDDARFLRIDQVDALAERIPPGKLTTVTEVPRTLWNTLLALAVVGAMLLAEWAVRKVYNMA